MQTLKWVLKFRGYITRLWSRFPDLWTSTFMFDVGKISDNEPSDCLYIARNLNVCTSSEIRWEQKKNLQIYTHQQNFIWKKNILNAKRILFSFSENAFLKSVRSLHLEEIDFISTSVGRLLETLEFERWIVAS